MAFALATFNSRLERAEQSKQLRTVRNIEIFDKYSFKLFDADGNVTKTYQPSKTGYDFHASDDFVRLMLGPFGSGKTTTNIADIVIRACAMPRCYDGIRRDKVVVLRNTSGELETSTVASWDAWFGDLGQICRRKKPVITWEHAFNDGHGPIELTMVFLACDRPEDIKKLKSTEFTDAYLNEANELPRGLLDFIKGRLGRYPSKTMCPESYFSGIGADANPPNTDHDLYEIFEVKKPSGYRIFKQPPGLFDNPDSPGKYLRNPNADNVDNLPYDYYTKMAEGADKEFVKVYCKGEYGLVLSGKPVYPQYNDDFHAVDHIEIDADYPVYLGFDFGSTPACVISQYVGDQLRVIKEFVSDFNTHMQAFASGFVKPYLDQFCTGMDMYGYHDPSDPDGQATGVAPSQVLEALGIPTEPSVTNLEQPRIDAVKSFLSRLNVNGKPAFIISKEGCPQLRKGLYGKYEYKLVHSYGETHPKEKPHKTHPISDVQDALQYICVGIYQGEPVTKSDSSSLLIPAGQRGFG